MIQLNRNGLHAREEITEVKERTMQKSYKEETALWNFLWRLPLHTCQVVIYYETRQLTGH